jgi:hypothetical protein
MDEAIFAFVMLCVLFVAVCLVAVAVGALEEV